MTLHTYTPYTNVPTMYQLPTPYGFQDIYLGQDFTGQGHYMARLKVKSRSDHDVAHLLTNVSTKYQLPTAYSF